MPVHLCVVMQGEWESGVWRGRESGSQVVEWEESSGVDEDIAVVGAVFRASGFV